MDKVLFVNACVNREKSRTLRLARALIGQFENAETEEIVLEELNLRPLDSAIIGKRNALAARGEFDDPVFAMSKKLASADIVVIATPFWENTFSSMTKIFMEYSGAVGVAFRYSESGMPVGMCKAKCLYYVTTRGGPVTDGQDLGYAIYRSLARTYGIGRTEIISADSLDIVANDPEKIMADAIARIPSVVRSS